MNIYDWLQNDTFFYKLIDHILHSKQDWQPYCSAVWA